MQSGTRHSARSDPGVCVYTGAVTKPARLIIAVWILPVVLSASLIMGRHGARLGLLPLALLTAYSAATIASAVLPRSRHRAALAWGLCAVLVALMDLAGAAVERGCAWPIPGAVVQPGVGVGYWVGVVLWSGLAVGLWRLWGLVARAARAAGGAHVGGHGFTRSAG